VTYGLRSAILSQKAVISCFSVLSPTVRRADGVYQDHRHDWEGRIARLTHKGEFTFVLLGVAEPARPDQHDHGAGCSYGLFQRANPKADPPLNYGGQRRSSGPSGFLSSHAFQARPPCLSIATCSSFAMEAPPK